jgi:hypothetical protein
VTLCAYYACSLDSFFHITEYCHVEHFSDNATTAALTRCGYLCGRCEAFESNMFLKVRLSVCLPTDHSVCSMVLPDGFLHINDGS